MANEEGVKESIALQTLKRCTRIETKLMTLARSMGHNLRTEDNVVVFPLTKTAIIETMDVAVCDVINAAHRAGVHHTTIKVMCGDRVVAESMYV